ncbi:MAG TPA: S-adenosylmethionine:tRNA ribosyltransferase-isomerase, partial [Polyangia bacterium]|nr:S-adenosylmethionine:tRNA ribosyltransferase-isomerase [Polyangia bacterium]
MTAAAWPREAPTLDRLLHLDPRTGRRRDLRVGALPDVLAAGDLVVLNDSATLPASLRGRLDGAPVEVRLAGRRDDGAWNAVLFGAGDWRTRTEDRAGPPAARAGARIAFGLDLGGLVASVSPLSPRLVALRFDGDEDAFWTALY